MYRLSLLIVALFLVATSAMVQVRADESAGSKALVVVVMDPLAMPLSCPCVAGYAQRDYEKLAASLTRILDREVKVVFNDSLVTALKKENARADLIIGKQSVILHDAKTADLQVKKVAMLSGKDGLTTQRGLLVVATADPAKSVADLKDYRIFFGPQECDEKHGAALRLLKQSGVASPAKLETAVACDEGAVKILKLATENVRGCAVISSYAKPLLEGCGQVPKGSLRVIGETEEIPFVAAYVNTALDAELQTTLSNALLKSTKADFLLRRALETKDGFVVVEEPGAVAKKK